MTNSKRKAAIIRHRRDKNLCERCGTSSCDKISCVETYDRSDMEKPEKLKYTQKDRKKNSIRTYRKKKNLCVLCGMEDLLNHTCNENYVKSDMRNSGNETIVKTPKRKKSYIKDIIKTEKVNKEYIETSTDPLNRMVPTEDLSFNRKHVVIDVSKSETNQLIEYSYLEFMIKRYPSFLFFLIGNPSSVFTLYEMTQLKKFINVQIIENLLDINIINHMSKASRVFGFSTRYLVYCLCHIIPCTIFLDSPEDHIPCNMVKIDPTENVTIDVVKRDILSWRI